MGIKKDIKKELTKAVDALQKAEAALDEAAWLGGSFESPLGAKASTRIDQAATLVGTLRELVEEL